MGQLLLTKYSLLGQYSWEMSTHKSIKISIAFASWEVRSSEQGKRNHHLQKPLLIVDTILHTVKGCDSFK